MNKDFFNSAAKWALVLGCLMSLSRIFEIKAMASGDVSLLYRLSIEWIAASLAYIFVLYRATKSRGKMLLANDSNRGYRAGEITNFAVTISAMSGVIVGIVSHIYIANIIGGYYEFFNLYAKTIMNFASEVELPSSMADFYKESANRLLEQGDYEQSLLSTMLSSASTYILTGFAVGGVIGLITKRKSEPKTTKNDVGNGEK